MPGLRVAHTTRSMMGLPSASTILALSAAVPPIAKVSAAGATVTTNEPRVALMGALPARGVSTSEIVGFVPDRIVAVVDPRCVSTPPASNACIVMVRFEPAGSVIVPDATPLAMGILNTSSVVMSGAVTSTTRLATVAADTSARTSSVTRSSGGSVRSRGTHAPTASRASRAAGSEARPVCGMTRLRSDADRRGPHRPLERREYVGVAEA